MLRSTIKKFLSQNQVFFVGVITTLGVFVRYKVSAIREFPYVDEYATLSQANLPISELLQQNATFWNGEYWGQFWDVAHPSLYYILFKYWIGFGEILGISSLHFAHFARLPSLFAYILTSIFLWKIAKKNREPLPSLFCN